MPLCNFRVSIHILLHNQSVLLTNGCNSLTAAGVGLNMTAAEAVIFAELYWNPGVSAFSVLLQIRSIVHF